MYVSKDIETYWKAFGDKRFTKADLWREFGGNAFPGFPTPEFMERLNLQGYEWIELAPGARGGDGWKLSAALALKMKKRDDAKAARRTSSEDMVAKVVTPIGAFRLEPSFQQNRKDRFAWSFRPPIEIEGRNVDGGRRSARGKFWLYLSTDSQFDKIQNEVTAAVTYVCGLALEQKARVAKQIEILNDLAKSAGQ